MNISLAGAMTRSTASKSTQTNVLTFKHADPTLELFINGKKKSKGRKSGLPWSHRLNRRLTGKAQF
jgi:hypothetical protein